MKHWNWPMVDPGRANRAHELKIVSMDVTSDSPHLVCKGSGGEYEATLTGCTCPDYSINANKRKPMACKHMVRLAMECGILNDNGLTVEEQRQADIIILEQQLAIFAWHYYVLKKPDISDADYDAMKSRYLEMIGQ